MKNHTKHNNKNNTVLVHEVTHVTYHQFRPSSFKGRDYLILKKIQSIIQG